MMYLVDTNVFLEILLDQSKKDVCKQFLDTNVGRLHLSEFSLHSIGIILFRYGQETVFSSFLTDVLPNILVVSLPLDQYGEVVTAKTSMALDFDDAYQYRVAKSYELAIVTMDQDFESITDVPVSFL